MHGSRVLVLGTAYKKNVSDVRESPAIEVIEQLQERGAIVEYHDRYVKEMLVNGQKLSSLEGHASGVVSLAFSTDRDAAKDRAVFQSQQSG